MKLQELLTKHKNKSIFNNMNMKLCNTDWDKHRFHIALEWWARWYVSLSDLLFSTPFLSLLEWDDNKCDKIWVHQYMKWWKFVEWYSIYEQYHKINLVLLDTDQERIDYIEENTI